MTSSLIDLLEKKAGNTLNKTNRAKLTEAASLISAVLDTVRSDNDEEKGVGSDAPLVVVSQDGESVDITEKLADLDDDMVKMNAKLDALFALLEPETKSAGDDEESEGGESEGSETADVEDLSAYL